MVAAVVNERPKAIAHTNNESNQEDNEHLIKWKINNWEARSRTPYEEHVRLSLTGLFPNGVEAKKAYYNHEYCDNQPTRRYQSVTPDVFQSEYSYANRPPGKSNIAKIKEKVQKTISIKSRMNAVVGRKYQ